MQRVEWICEEEKELIGYGKKKKGDRFQVTDMLAEQLISQGLVKDVYVERKFRGRKKKED